MGGEVCTRNYSIDLYLASSIARWKLQSLLVKQPPPGMGPSLVKGDR